MKKLIIIFSFLTTISCSRKEVHVQEIPFFYDNSNAQPNLVSYNGSLSLSWISSKEENKAFLNYSQYKEGRWIKPQVITSGSDWFVNWADFPAHAINQDLIITSHLKKSASGKYTYDVILNFLVLGNINENQKISINLDNYHLMKLCISFFLTPNSPHVHDHWTLAPIGWSLPRRV